MTMDLGHLPSSSPVSTPIQAALDRVTSPQPRPSVFADQPIPKELTLPKLYSEPLPLPRTSPVMPVLDEAPVESTPSPMDSENDLPLNSIPMAKLLNTYLPEDASLMPIIISGPSLKEPGTVVKLLVSAPKPPQRRYGQSRNQRCRAAHAKACEDLVKELEKAADNRFYEWLEVTDKSTDAEVVDLLAGIPAEQPSQDNPAVHSPPGLSSPSHLYQSPLPPVDEEMSKYDVESEWMDSESEKETDRSPSPRVPSFSSSSAFQPVQPQPVYATGPAVSPILPLVSRVEGQPSCDGQVLHAPCGKRVEGHSHYRELDLRDHPHPQKYARSVAPSVATFEFTDVRSREPYAFDRTLTPARLRHANVIVSNERVPCQPMPVSPFRPEACAPDSRGYANVVRKPSITVPATTSAPIEPSWVWKPTGRPQILALMSLEITPPTKNTQFGNNSTHENYMWMLQHAREQGRPRREDCYNILVGVHQAPVNHPVRQMSWKGLRTNSGQPSTTTHY